MPLHRAAENNIIIKQCTFARARGGRGGRDEMDRHADPVVRCRMFKIRIDAATDMTIPFYVAPRPRGMHTWNAKDAFIT